MAGWLCGKKVLSMKNKKQPTAYSYNGVVLPKLPVWDKSLYKFASICYTGSKYILNFHNKETYYTKKSSGFEYVATKEDDLNLQYYLWDGWDLQGVKKSSAGTSMYPPIWVNGFDVLYDTNEHNGELSGSLYLASSDTIPVYE